MRWLLTGAACCALLTACGSSNPHHLTGGQVVDKGQQAGFDYLYQQLMPHEQCTTSYKGTETCTTYYTYIFIPMHQDPTWWVKVQDCSTGKCYKGTLYLTPEEWAPVRIGQQYGISAADRTAPPTHKAES